MSLLIEKLRECPHLLPGPTLGLAAQWLEKQGVRVVAEAEDTETVCREILSVIGMSEEPSFDLLNLVADFALRCEHEGRVTERLVQKTYTLEFQTGFLADRRQTTLGFGSAKVTGGSNESG